MMRTAMMGKSYRGGSFLQSQVHMLKNLKYLHMLFSFVYYRPLHVMFPPCKPY